MKRLYICRNFELRNFKTEHYQLNLLNAMTRAGHRQWEKWVAQPAPTVNNQYRTTSNKQLPPTTTIKISRNSIAAKSTTKHHFLDFFSQEL